MIPSVLDRLLSGAPGRVGAGYNAYKAYRWGDPYIRLIAALADRSRAAVDIGAHLGDYTFFMRRHAAQCIAFECNPALYGHLKRLYGATVDIRPEAVSDQAGATVLRIPTNEQTGLGRATIEMSNPLAADFAEFRQVAVTMVRLDDAVTQPVGLIKIDVEGHEMSVLRGATRILERDRPNLIIELEERHAPGCAASAFDLLGRLGYQGARLEGGRLVAEAAGGPVAGDGNYVFTAAA